MNYIKLKDHIVITLKREDLELYSRHERGIFFMPELGIVYLVGKEIVAHAPEIFGVKVSKWNAEMKVNKDRGPCDLILELEDDKKIVFEFKHRTNDYTGYINDIIKLAEIKSTEYRKFFCALILEEAGQEKVNLAIKKVEEEFGDKIKRVTDTHGQFEYFNVKDHYLSNKHNSCIIALWNVL